MPIPTYKLAHTQENNDIAKIYVFYGKLPEGTSLDVLFTMDNENVVFKEIFSAQELQVIREKGIPVIFLEGEVYPDDTIEVIKEKILQYCGLNISFSEIYLFAQEKERLSALSIFKTLTQNEKLDLTRERLIQYLLNIDITGSSIDTLEDKPLYTYDDIVSLGLDGKDALVTIPIGQRFVALDKNIQYTVNPFSLIVYDSFLERYAQEITSTSNKNLLMNVGTDASGIFNNMLYLCTASEVMNYTISRGLSQESTIKIYFPYLLEKKILSLEQLQERKQELLVDSERLITEGFEKQNKMIGLYYTLHKERTDNAANIEQGSCEIEFIIHPEVDFNLPLDIVFKLIHATREVPLIKYNPAKKQDKLYRLYTNKVATNGKKIPYLDKTEIFKLAKTIGKTKRVSVYIEYRASTDGVITPIVCDFTESGSINVSAQFSKPHTLVQINKVLQAAINPVIDVIKMYLSQNGYSMRLFSSLNDPNIEIVTIDYIVNVPITKPIKLKTIMACVSPVFNVINDDFKNGIIMRFKRVANYNEMDSIDAFISDMLNREYSESDIFDLLVSNFNMTEKNAKAKLIEFINSLQVGQDAFQRRKLKVRNNPGFLTTIVQEKFSKSLIITITGINNMHYLNTIPIYIDSFVQLTQQENKEMCKGQAVSTAAAAQIVDIVSGAEQVNEGNRQMNIVAQELVFEEAGAGAEEANEEDMFDYFFGEGEGEGGVEGEGEGGVEDEGEGGVEGEGEGGVEEGGGPKKSQEESFELDITGKRLTHPNPFQDRIVKRDPNLFVNYKDDNFKDYSRTCPWNVRRHPVILTDEEKERIDREHPGSYEKDSAVKYGSDKDKQFWYICPHYWSLKDNTTLTEAEVASGKYGKVIPRDGKKVGPGEAIFNFDEEVYHRGKKGEYKELHPGFLKPSAQGKCLPCCFKDWQSVEQKERRDICAVDTSASVAESGVAVAEEPVEAAVAEEVAVAAAAEAAAPAAQNKPKKSKKSTITDDYIKGADKYPLEQNRYGFLPLAIQHFLKTDNKKCQISLSNTNLKPYHICMVRRGVEFSKSQSFIACISDIYTGIYQLPQQSIVVFKETLISAMTIDLFLSLQNGNLITIFAPDDLMDVNSDIIDVEEFKTSIVYKQTDMASYKQRNTLMRIVFAFNNFKEYLRDNTIDIEYTYLWDLICFPNAKLFKTGLNMGIVEMTNSDITNNASIVCPSNHYASTFFDDYKDTVIIIKHNKVFDNKTYNLYEPVYAIEDKKNEFSITYAFKLNALVNINATIELIKQSFGKCGTYPSMPKVYEFKRNISLDRLVDLLDLKSYTVEKQVMNFNGKVIGVIAKKTKGKGAGAGMRGFIPCFPSAFIKYLDTGFIWMDDDYSDTYKNTMTFLNTVYKDLNGRIPCKPKIKVVEDELIVGILTETNQFIMLSEPVADTFGDDLLKNADMGIVRLSSGKDNIDIDTLVDIETETNSSKVDVERISYINNIQTESKFYNIFRTTARVLLGQMRYRSIKEKIERVINTPTILYLDKLKQVDQLLHDLMKKSIEFSVYDPKLLTDDIINCNSLEKDQCSQNKFCLEKEDGSCALIIPDKNLINGTDNEVVYFSKLADELIRYNRIKSFIFQQNVFLSFSPVKYNLNENEIILLQSLLTNEYFDGLIIAPSNKYIKHNSYDSAQPIKSQTYSTGVPPPATQAVSPQLEGQAVRTQLEGQAVSSQLEGQAVRSQLEGQAVRSQLEGQAVKTQLQSQVPAKALQKESKCDEPTSILITSPYWKPLFPENSIEIIFHDNPPLCTFDIILIILKNSKLSKYDLKEILVEEYSHYYNDYKFEIIQILKLQGKHKIAKQLIYKKSTLANIIMSEDYYATNMDLWLLAIHFKLPIIFFSGTELIENGEKFFVANMGEGEESFYFIKTPGIKNDVPNSYRLLAAPTYKVKLPLSALKPEFAESIRASVREKDNILTDYLNRVGLLDATQKLKAKKVKLLTDEEVAVVIPSEPANAEPAEVEPAKVEPAKAKATKTKKKIVLSG